MSYTIDNNPFYNAVFGDVSKEIDTRASMYAARDRGTSNSAYIHSWLHRKTAYVKIYYNDKIILEPPKKGFNDVYGKDLYPPAVVNSVRISNEGDYGSLLKAEINFSVFTLSQLSYYTKNLLFVGAYNDLAPIPVKIEYGWTAGNDGPAENFYGFVTNFNWTLRPDGGFDCVSQLVGEGYFSLGTKAGAIDTVPNLANPFGESRQVQPEQSSAEELSTGNLKRSPLGWIDSLMTFDLSKQPAPKTIKSLVLVGNTISASDGDGAAIIDVPVSTQSSENKEESTEASKLTLYVTLDYVCRIVTTALQQQAVFKDHQYISTGDVSRGHKYDSIVSADPINVLFPGFATYGDKNLTEGINISMSGGSTANLSKILISAQCLRDIVTEMKNEFAARNNFKDTDETTSNFFKKLFNRISSASGGLYNLALVTPVTAERSAQDLRTWLVMDTQYLKKPATTNSKVPKIIPTMKSSSNGYGGICRSVSLTSTLPNAMATAQFISAASVLSNKVPVSSKEITAARLKLSDATSKLIENARAAISNGFNPEDVDVLRNSLAQFKTAASVNDSSWASGFPIPLNLQLVMDGIKGFRFGNTITIDYLPEGYENVVFTVTKIEHNITNNDWTTTLSTVCRLKV